MAVVIPWVVIAICVIAVVIGVIVLVAYKNKESHTKEAWVVMKICLWASIALAVLLVVLLAGYLHSYFLVSWSANTLGVLYKLCYFSIGCIIGHIISCCIRLMLRRL